MSNNMGSTDRAIRIVIGAALLLLVFAGPRTAWGWLGLIPLATAFGGFCPLYRVLGLSTNRKATRTL
jgi:Inner membrane protein YgaP-like, transmembrane domain